MEQKHFLILPLKRIKDAKKDEAYERTQLVISGLDREKKRKKRERNERPGLPLPMCRLLFFIGLKVKTELTTTNSPPH